MDSFSDTLTYLGSDSVYRLERIKRYKFPRCLSCKGSLYDLCNHDCFLYGVFVVDNLKDSCFDCESLDGVLLGRFYYGDIVSRSFSVQLVNSFATSDSLTDVLVDRFQCDKTSCNVA